MISDGTRVFVNLVNGTRQRGKLNGNYKGEGPVKVFDATGQQIIFPAEQIRSVEERSPR